MNRLDIEFIREEFKKEGYRLLSTEYKNNRQRLNFLCKNNHNHFITWANWTKGNRCKKCATEELGNLLRKDFSNIKQSIESEGYQLLTEESDYKSNKKTKLAVICPNNHQYTVTWSCWQSGTRCVECLFLSRRKNINNIRQSFEEEGYQLLTTKYKNSLQHLSFICPNNHTGVITWGHWNSGKRCGVCSGNKQLDIEFIREGFKKEGYKLLSTEYKNNKQRLSLECPEGHKVRIRWDMWGKGCRCGVCFNSHSKAEKDVVDFIKENYTGVVIENDKRIINPFELDVVLPDKKLAIEYCGLYWHSEKQGRDNKYHLTKLNSCNEAGYDLIIVFEDEWIYKRDIVKARILHRIGVPYRVKVYARKCKISEIDTGLKNTFLEVNHLQGMDRSSIKLGAFFNGWLVSVMTFSKLNVAKGGRHQENSYELNRFCSDYTLHAIGIASRLFKYFITNYPVNKIITYGDKRWSKGELYQHLGFTYAYDSKPNYWYVKVDKRIHRYNFRKSELNKKLKNFDPNLTEWQNMQNNNYTRIWDCGNVKWVWERK